VEGLFFNSKLDSYSTVSACLIQGFRYTGNMVIGGNTMKRPAKVPASAVYDKEFDLWIVTKIEGDYEVEYHYGPDGRLIMVLELEI
jgi:hypothetical protein